MNQQPTSDNRVVTMLSFVMFSQEQIHSWRST
jgi:hypothetical protein